MGTLCGLFGKTRNAYYDHRRRATTPGLLDGLVLALMDDLRADLPRLGTRKLLLLLGPRLGEHAARVGRDYLFALLAEHGRLIRRRQRRVVTTQPCGPDRRRLNLIEHLTVTAPEQVWVSDSTYCVPSGRYSQMPSLTPDHRCYGQLGANCTSNSDYIRALFLLHPQ